MRRGRLVGVVASVPGTTIVNDVTKILVELQRGEQGADQRLLAIVYEELRRVASQRLIPGKARPNPPGDRAGPRDVSETLSPRETTFLAWPRALLCRGRQGDGLHIGRPSTKEIGGQARG